MYGVSGVTPGEKAEKTVYGSPVQTIAVPKTKDGISMTVGDVITSFWIFIIPIHISAMAVWTRCKSLRIRLNLRYMQEF